MSSLSLEVCKYELGYHSSQNAKIEVLLELRKEVEKDLREKVRQELGLSGWEGAER